MSSPIAIGAAELTLSAALMRLIHARSPEERDKAQQAVTKARARLEEVKKAEPPKERTCCGLRMTFHRGQWICTAGHD